MPQLTMQKFNQRDVGPFTPEAAAQRVKLASRQLKWFTLCHPHWAAAHCSLEWKTPFPWSRLDLPKGVRMTNVTSVEVTFAVGDRECPDLGKAFRAGAKLAGMSDCSIGIYGRGGPTRPGLGSLRVSLNPRGDWVAQAEVYHPSARTSRAALKLALEAGQLAAAKGWKLVRSTPPYRKRDCMTSHLSLKLSGSRLRQWLPAIEAVLSAQPALVRRASVLVRFNHDFVEDKNWWKGSRSVFKRTDGKPPGPKHQNPEHLLTLVAAAGLPGGEAAVYFDCTVARAEDFLGLFKLAVRCEPGIEHAIGIFETQAGKQGFLMFNASRKGIKLITLYGQNGWEDIHAELRRTNGNLDFSRKG